MLENNDSRYEQLDNYRIFIDRLIIEGKINVDQLPDEIRLSSRLKPIYVLAFRRLRSVDNANEYLRTLNQLDKDIDTLRASGSAKYASSLDDFLIGNMADMIKNYKGTAQFDEFMAEQKRKRPLLFETYLRAAGGSYDN